jgi:hypothetical protein
MVPMTLSASLPISVRSVRLLGDCLLKSIRGGGQLPAAVLDDIAPHAIQGARKVLDQWIDLSIEHSRLTMRIAEPRASR